MKKLSLLTLLIMLIVLGSCGDTKKEFNENQIKVPMNKMNLLDMSFKSDNYSSRNYVMRVAQSALNYGELKTPHTQDTKYIIKNATVECNVQDFSISSRELKSIIARLGGYITWEKETSDNWQKRGTIVVRIDCRKFDTLINAMCTSTYSVRDRLISTQDITEEYFDNETRLRTKRATEEQYMIILKQAKSIEDVLNVREKLGSICEEIESMEGRQNYLRNQVAYSTINFTFIQQLPNTGSNLHEDSFSNRVWSSIVNGWTGLINSLLFLVGSWNVLLVCGIAYIAYRLVIKKRVKRSIVSLRNLIKGNSESV
jgi:hypothetical protein